MVTLRSVTRQVEPQTQRPTLRSEQAALTRSRIIEGAKAVFEARGYEGARIEDIASEAGVAVPTVYKVFANKRNLLKASVEAAIRGGKRARWSGRPGFVSSSKSPPPRDSCASSLATPGVCTTVRGNCSKSCVPRQPATAI
jgi:Bacterial regulatory proteins, tetR family